MLTPTYRPPLARVTPKMPWEPRIHAIASVLRRRTGGDSTVAEQVATAIVRQADRMKMSPSLLAGVVLVENTTLKPSARNRRSGATGLMQVMPFHAGKLGCGSHDLTDVESNICHGAKILRDDIRETKGNVDRALLQYNGCVRRGRRHACRRYPGMVFANVELVRREIELARRAGPGGLTYLNQVVTGRRPVAARSSARLAKVPAKRPAKRLAKRTRSRTPATARGEN